MPRVRFTVRRMMVAVAVIALACGLEVGRRRRSDFLRIAAEHAQEEEWSLSLAQDSVALARTAREKGERSRKRSFWGKLSAPAYGIVGGQFDREVSRSREEASFHAEMRRKYERAARFPWLPVAPDPPAPH